MSKQILEVVFFMIFEEFQMLICCIKQNDHFESLNPRNLHIFESFSIRNDITDYHFRIAENPSFH